MPTYLYDFFPLKHLNHTFMEATLECRERFYFKNLKKKHFQAILSKSHPFYISQTRHVIRKWCYSWLRWHVML